MPGYDDWRLASPYDDGPDLQAVADFYGVDSEQVTDRMQEDYPHDKMERELTRWED